MNIWTIIYTIIGALIAGLSVLLNSIYSSKSIQKREDRNRLINEKESEIKELELLYEKSLHIIDKMIRLNVSIPPSDLEEFFKIDIRLKLISTKIITKKVKEFRNEISEMAKKLPRMPEEFIPNFEEDHDRKTSLERRKIVIKERETKSKEFTPDLRNTFQELSELMKRDLQDRKMLNIEDYIKYKKNC